MSLMSYVTCLLLYVNFGIFKTFGTFKTLEMLRISVILEIESSLDFGLFWSLVGLITPFSYLHCLLVQFAVSLCRSSPLWNALKAFRSLWNWVFLGSSIFLPQLSDISIQALVRHPSWYFDHCALIVWQFSGPACRRCMTCRLLLWQLQFHPRSLILL